MEMFLNIVPVLGIAALLFAALLAARVSKQNAGTDKMKEIAAAIGEGAQAFLTAEYKIQMCIRDRSSGWATDLCC